MSIDALKLEIVKLKNEKWRLDARLKKLDEELDAERRQRKEIEALLREATVQKKEPPVQRREEMKAPNDPNDLAGFLQELRCQRYLDQLIASDIVTVNELKMCGSDTDLTEIGIPVGPRRRIQYALLERMERIPAAASVTSTPSPNTKKIEVVQPSPSQPPLVQPKAAQPLQAAKVLSPPSTPPILTPIQTKEEPQATSSKFKHPPGSRSHITPRYACKRCKVFGHFPEDCPRLPGSLKQEGTPESPRQIGEEKRKHAPGARAHLRPLFPCKRCKVFGHFPEDCPRTRDGPVMRQSNDENVQEPRTGKLATSLASTNSSSTKQQSQQRLQKQQQQQQQQQDPLPLFDATSTSLDENGEVEVDADKDSGSEEEEEILVDKRPKHSSRRRRVTA